MGLDIGLRRNGVGVADDKTLQICLVDFTLITINGVQYRIKLTPRNYIYVAEKFVEVNDALFKTITDVAIEIQMKSSMEQFAQALGGMIRGRHKHINIRHASPISTRTFYNTRVQDKRIPDKRRYPLRKQLSVATLPRLIPRHADRHRFDELFGDKKDDAVEAALLALWAHHVPERQRVVSGRPDTSIRTKSIVINIPTDDPKTLALTDAERLPFFKKAMRPVTKRRVQAAPNSP